MADRAENILPEVLSAWDFGGQVVGCLLYTSRSHAGHDKPTARFVFLHDTLSVSIEKSGEQKGLFLLLTARFTYLPARQAQGRAALFSSVRLGD